MRHQATWPPSMLLPLFFWFSDIDSQVLGLGSWTRAAAAAAFASEAPAESSVSASCSHDVTTIKSRWPVQLHRRHAREVALLVGAEGVQAVGDVGASPCSLWSILVPRTMSGPSVGDHVDKPDP